MVNIGNGSVVGDFIILKACFSDFLESLNAVTFRLQFIDGLCRSSD